MSQLGTTEPDTYEAISNEEYVLEVPAPGVLLNDQYVDTALLVPNTGPTHGVLTFNSDGSFVYVPSPGYQGVDTFQYIAVDSVTGEHSAPETVTIDVVYYAPTPFDDSYELYVESEPSLQVPAPGLLANDQYADEVELVADTGPDYGSLTLKADGSFTYTPFAHFDGTDSFEYIAIDTYTGIASQPTTVTITVICYYCSGLLLDQPPIDSTTPALDAGDVGSLGREAVRRWTRAGVDKETLEARLANLQFAIADLPGSLLASTTANVITIDVNGAGHGWFIDVTPDNSREFQRRLRDSQRQASGNSAAVGHPDLLTVLMHEIGHLLKLDHADAGSGNIMEGTLGLGIRRLPTALDAAAADYLFSISQDERERQAMGG